MIQAAQKVVFCFDHTKFGRKSVLPLCGLDCLDEVVTDHAAPLELVQALRERDITVVVAPEGGS
jgi:DeoR/GlpR family transcriptional regulator of sugar metabolism